MTTANLVLLQAATGWRAAPSLPRLRLWPPQPSLPLYTVSRVVTRPREAIPHDQAEPPSTTSQGVWATIQLLARLDAAGLAQWEAFELLLQFGCMIDQGVPLGVAEKKTLVRATARPVAWRSRVSNVAP